jgi:hypothetical protein
MDGFLELQLGGIIVQLVEFSAETETPIRKEIQEATTARSAAGSFVSYGPSYPLPQVWQGNFYVSYADSQALLTLWEVQQQNRQPVLLTDTMQPFQELAPRSRGKALSPFDMEMATFGSVIYYGTWHAWFVRRPQLVSRQLHTSWGQDSLLYSVTLEDTGLKTAP